MTSLDRQILGRDIHTQEDSEGRFAHLRALQTLPVGLRHTGGREHVEKRPAAHHYWI